ncbi:MAG: Gfo/Idh/MocA family oxidoreductase [Clostridia bacterium]|nr:Gfo/Idh/MocA family oxidoreductase [Clostridia bacterium]
MDKKRYAIIGFGGLGKTHFHNLMKIEKQRGDMELVAICNEDLEAITQNVQLNITAVSMENFDFSKYNLYTDYKEMLAKEKLDFVFIALPSFLHCEVAVYCMEQGADVYTEKPMAITLEQCNLMMETAQRTGKKLMVGHCLRFTDEYVFIKNAIQNNTYGKPIKAEFSRKSPIPNWSAGGWLLNEEKSGGCLVDMHVHDVDMMVWLFGAPEEVQVVTSHQMSSFESAYAIYRYPNLSVSIIADWGIQSSFPFEAKYAITFEDAYIESVNGKVTVYTNEGKFEPELPGVDPMYDEVVEFLNAVIDGKPFKTADVNSVKETMKVVFREKELGKA